MPLSAGDRLSHFEVLSLLGKGGMGEVYLARDTKLKRDVAIKVLPEAFSLDPERMARFQREAEVLASLNHPNIATIHGVEDRALVMELVEGESPKGPLPFEEAWKIASQIAAALEYAHERGIIHRDLKPANIMVTSEGVVKLLDFGLAKAFSNQREPSASPENSPTLTLGATEVGVILGTAAYMAPEQARGKAVDKRADIWSFGVVLQELLTGERLFTGEDAAETLAAVIHKQPDLTKAPPQARKLLRRCLEKDPKKRLRDIGDAWDLVGEAEAPSGPAAVSDASRSWFGWAGRGLMGLLLLALVALGFAHFREAAPPDPPRPMRFEIPVPDKVTPIRGGFLSPDGTKFVFPAVGPSGTQVWIRSLDALDAHPIPGTEGSTGTRPFWSPDSRFIVFEAAGKAKKVDIAGGPVQTLCDLNGVLLGGAWTQDGFLILGSNVGPIMRVSSGGGVPVPVTQIATGEAGHQFPFLLPDQRSFVYRAGDAEGSIYVGLVHGKPEQQSRKAITRSDAAAMYAPSPLDPMQGHLLSVQGGTLLAQSFDASKMQANGDPFAIAEQVGKYNSDSMVSVSNNGTLLYRAEAANTAGLAWHDRQGNLLGSPGETSRRSRLVLSPDATRVALGHTAPNYISIFEFSRGTDTRVTFGDVGDDRFPVWSPDATRIAYVSTSSIYQKASNGVGSPELLFQSPISINLTDWSRDGRYLLYWGSNGTTASDILVLPLEGDRKPFAFNETRFSEQYGRFSPDAHWIAYLSTESGPAEINVGAFNGIPSKGASGLDGKWQVSKGHAAFTTPAWRGDSKEIYYLSEDRYLMAVDVSTNPTFQPGTPKRLFALPPGVTMFDAAPDGKRFLFPVSLDTGKAMSFTIVLNWQAALKR